MIRFNRTEWAAKIALAAALVLAAAGTAQASKVVHKAIARPLPQNSLTAQLPPCDGVGVKYKYVNAEWRFHLRIEGATPEEALQLRLEHGIKTCPAPVPLPGLGGPSTENFDSNLRLEISGEGNLEGVHCTIVINDVPVQATSQPRDPALAVEMFGAEITSLDGMIPAPETSCNLFSSLRVRAGAGLGIGLNQTLGTTKITARGDGDHDVESFFDVFFRIDWVGKAGGPLDGLSGTEINDQPLPMVLQGPDPIPTLSQWGMIILVGLLMAAALFMMRRRRAGLGIAGA